MDDEDDDDAYDLVQRRDEVINGVCVRQPTEADLIRKRRRGSLDYDNDSTVRVEPTAAFAEHNFRTKSDAKNNGNERENNIKRLEKSLEEDEEGWDDDDMDEDEVRPVSAKIGGINDDNVLEECVQ